jgi:hypothetical protein
VVTPGAIVIVHAGTGDARKGAQNLRQEVREVLLTSGLAKGCRDGGVITCDNPTPEPFFSEKDRQKLLVLVCDKSMLLAERPWFARWQAAGTDSILPVVPAGASPASLLPTDELRKINVAFWSKLITEAVPPILARAGLTTDEQMRYLTCPTFQMHPFRFCQDLTYDLFDSLRLSGFGRREPWFVESSEPPNCCWAYRITPQFHCDSIRRDPSRASSRTVVPDCCGRRVP